MTQVQFVSDIMITALERRFVGGEVADVPESVVDMLTQNGYAVLVEQPEEEQPTTEPTEEPVESSTPKRKTAKTTEPESE